MKKKLLFLMFLVCSFAASSSDVLTLMNQMTFEGKVTKIKKCTVYFEVGTDHYEIPAVDIYSIQFGNLEDKVYTDYLEFQATNPEACVKGRADAEAFHGKKGGHFFLGFLFGPLAIIGTALANPTPDKGRDTYGATQNKDLLTDPVYINCYKKKAKGQLIGAEFLGWGAWIMILLIATS
jgi:hypothetical protein